MNADSGIWVGSTDAGINMETTLHLIIAPNTPVKPVGPSEGKTNEEYEFVTNTIDSNNDLIQYGWDWNGDNNVDDWTDFYESGEEITTTHTWNTEGTYNIKVIAKDEWGFESGWSEPLELSIPKSKQYIPLGTIVVFGFDVDVKIVQLDPGEDYVDLEVLNKPFYILENEIQTRNPGEFIRLYQSKGLFSPSLPFCFGFCQDWGIIG